MGRIRADSPAGVLLLQNDPSCARLGFCASSGLHVVGRGGVLFHAGNDEAGAFYRAGFRYARSEKIWARRTTILRIAWRMRSLE